MEYESFEVNGTAYEPNPHTLINQITTDLIPESSDYGFHVKFHGVDEMTVCFSTFEMDLPSRIKQVESMANTRLGEYEKALKKKYKELAGRTLRLKEKKDQREHGSEKVSLNHRYYFRCYRTYTYR